jgi:hypothetical protein
MEMCNCEQSNAYRKAARDLAKAIIEYYLGKSKQHKGDYYPIGNLVNKSHLILKLTDRRRNGKD